MNIVERLFSFQPRWIPHVLFWVVIYFDELFSLVGITPEIYDEDKPMVFTSFILDFILVYFNIYVLFPLLYKKKKYILYLVVSLLSVVLSEIIQNHFFPIPDPYDGGIISNTFSAISYSTPIIGSAIGIKMMKDFYEEQKLRIQIQEKHYESQKRYLLGELNPHFLFNALNTLYIKARKKSDDLPDRILQMSDILRYQLYEGSKEFVPLKQELIYITNYMNLYLEKTDMPRTILQIEKPIPNLEIAPLLFQPIIENALKYYAKNTVNDVLSIIFTYNGREVTMVARNSYNPDTVVPKNATGLGIKNVKQRLELLYKGKHQLTIHEEDGIFGIEIRIELNEMYNRR